jgi:YbbR domain-containing protein
LKGEFQQAFCHYGVQFAYGHPEVKWRIDVRHLLSMARAGLAIGIGFAPVSGLQADTRDKQTTLTAIEDLKTARPGRRLFQLTPEQVRVPFGVEVVQVAPSSIALAFENSATRQLPVIPAIEGVPVAGFVVGKPVSNPATVEVIGPESVVTRATEALTEPISVAGARQDITETVNVGFQDPALRLKTPRQATVTVPILPGPVERTLQDQPVHLRNVDPNLIARAVPSAISIILRGSKEGLARTRVENITAYVDLAGLGAGDYSLGVQVGASSDAGVARIIPATVQVTLSRVQP